MANVLADKVVEKIVQPDAVELREGHEDLCDAEDYFSSTEGSYLLLAVSQLSQMVSFSFIFLFFFSFLFFVSVMLPED